MYRAVRVGESKDGADSPFSAKAAEDEDVDDAVAEARGAGVDSG